MTRTIVIVHGTQGSPDENWFPWLASKARDAGYKIVAPQFPTPESQTPAAWLSVLDASISELGPDTTLVGHSLGCALLLRALERPGSRVAGSFFVSGFLGALGNQDFDPLNAPFFVEPFEWSMIKQRMGSAKVIIGDDDPYVPLLKGEELAEQLGVDLTVVKNGGHLNQAAGFSEFPKLWADIQDTLLSANR